jgi:O-6-methylguanine DNA methyltransferase
VAENKHLLFIPCHRVIRSNGEIGEFRLGSEVKRYLLELEQAI